MSSRVKGISKKALITKAKKLGITKPHKFTNYQRKLC